MAKKKDSKKNDIFSSTAFKYAIGSNGTIVAKFGNECDRDTCLECLRETYPDCKFVACESNED